MAQESVHIANKKGFTSIVIVLVIILLIGGVYLTYQALGGKAPFSTRQQIIPNPTSAKPKLRSKAPGLVTQITLAKTIDPKNGSATSPATTFSKTDPTIYTIIALSKPPVGTKVEYARYLNGKFLDNRSTSITRANDNSVLFSWNLKKPGATRSVGSYKVKIYTNGVFEKEVRYSVQ